MLRTLTVVFVALLISFACALDPIKVQGADFVNSVTNARFQIIGVAYQPGGSAGFKPENGIDPLSNGTTCLRDAALMQLLGVNTIRVYNIDPSINHDLCASIFNDVGIYMIIDVNSPLPDQSINSGDPSSSYDSVYLERIFGVVEAFKDYPNLLGFFSGNEVINDVTTSQIDPTYVRAVTRDLKNYIAAHSSRTIPVGYSAADVRPVLVDTWQYLSCAINGSSTDMSKIDFFGLNSYSWCGPTATYTTSGYDVLVTDFSNTTIPVFFSEYGCNKIEPRVWNETLALYSPEMTAVMSGGLVYEWTEADNNYGLVNLSANGSAYLRVDYNNLQAKLNMINITSLESTNSTAIALTPPKCSTSIINEAGGSNFSDSWDLPAVPPGGQDLITNGVTNITNGQLVTVTQLNVTIPCFKSDGVEIQNLAITPLANNEVNGPSGQNDSAGTTGTATGSATATSTTGAAVKLGTMLGWDKFGLGSGIAGTVLGSMVLGALLVWGL